MFYQIYLKDTEAEIPAVAVCKSIKDVAALIMNMDKKYEVSGIEQFTAEFIESNKEMCTKPNDLEVGKGETNVNE